MRDRPKTEDNGALRQQLDPFVSFDELPGLGRAESVHMTDENVNKHTQHTDTHTHSHIQPPSLSHPHPTHTHLLAPVGRCASIGFLTTLSSVSDPLTARILSLCRSCTCAHTRSRMHQDEARARARTRTPAPHTHRMGARVRDAGGPRTISPAKRLNVRGMRMCGLTSISTFFSVWM